MQITETTKLCSGTYILPNGIDIYAESITLDCNGATLIGNGSDNGIHSTDDNNITIKNCNIENYSYGIYLSNSINSTITNNTASNKTYKAYIFTAAGTNEGAIIPVKIVVRNRFDVGASIVNQIIPAGGTLRMESSVADSVIFTVSGKELP